MRALIEKTDNEGDKSTFTIVGITEDDIDKQVYELQRHERRDSTYPLARYRVLKYNLYEKE